MKKHPLEILAMYTRKTITLVVLCGLITGLCACERTLIEELPEEETPGSFHAQAGQPAQGGFEVLEGSASFEIRRMADDTPVFLMRLSSLSPDGRDTTKLDFALINPSVPRPGEYSFGDPDDNTSDFSHLFMSCFRSPNLMGEIYPSESGSLTVTVANARQFEGTFDMTTYTLLQTGPDRFSRVRLKITGSFNAGTGPTGVTPDSVFECGNS